MITGIHVVHCQHLYNVQSENPLAQLKTLPTNKIVIAVYIQRLYLG